MALRNPAGSQAHGDRTGGWSRPLLAVCEGMEGRAQTWSVYLLRCADGTFYTGITTDLAARVARHNRGKGAKYTRGRGPVELAYAVEAGDRGQALKLEYSIKQLSREEKRRLISSHDKGAEDQGP